MICRFARYKFRIDINLQEKKPHCWEKWQHCEIHIFYNFCICYSVAEKKQNWKMYLQNCKKKDLQIWVCISQFNFLPQNCKILTLICDRHNIILQKNNNRKSQLREKHQYCEKYICDYLFNLLFHCWNKQTNKTELRDVTSELQKEWFLAILSLYNAKFRSHNSNLQLQFF